jgi:DNA-binding beta-propeller fold protein YncE
VTTGAGVIGETGVSPGQFSYPRCVDSDGSTLWVIDKLARVQRIDPKSGRAVAQWRVPKYDNGKPTGVTVWTPAKTPDQPLVFIADTHEHRVLVYDPGAVVEGKFEGHAPALVANFGTYGTEADQFIYTTDVAVLASADGNRIARLYVGEYGGNDRIMMYEPVDPQYTTRFPELKLVRMVGSMGSSPTRENVQFARPQSLAIDLDRRELLVADACNHRIGRFTLDMELLAWYGSPESAGEAPGAFNYPYGVIALGDGSTLVAEFGNCRLQRIDLATGQSLGILGRRGRGAGELATPWAMAMTGDVVYVLDSGNNRIFTIARPTGTRPLLTARSTDIGVSAGGGGN